MKIAIVTNYWKESSGGGIKNYLVNLVDEFSKKNDFEIRVLFREGKDNENFIVEGNTVLFVVRSFLILKKLRPRVIHSQGTWYCLMAGYMYKKFYRSRLVHTFRSEPEKELPFLARIIIQKMLDECDCVTFVSEGLKSSIMKVYGLNFKTTVITYPGVKKRLVSEEEIKDFYIQYNINFDSIVLLIQAFTAYKLKAEGVKYVLKSVKLLRDKYPNIVLVLTRSGKYSEELKKYADDIKVSENVVFTGDVSNPFVSLDICDIFLFPWLGMSGVSNALLEAMIMSKPIIATTVNGNGVSEVIDDGVHGILVSPDSQLIADSIDFLIADPTKARELGNASKNLAETFFTWDIIVDEFVKIYSGYYDDDVDWVV